MKKFTMKNSIMSSWSKRSAAIGSMLALAFFAACGDDVTNDSVVKAESFADKADLPSCSEKYEGMFATIPSKGDIYFCTQKKWQTVVSGKSADAKVEEPTCSTVELADKSGFKVVCGGDSVAVVKNGAKGAQGEKGEDGNPGSKGPEGDPGSKGAPGKDFTLDSNLCVTRYYAEDVLILECGDSTYVADMTDYGTAIKTWWPSQFIEYLSYVEGSPATDGIKTVSREDGTGAKSQGTLVRWDGDVFWESGYNITREELVRNDAIAGTATMKVDAGATLNDSLGTEPFVGVEITRSNGLRWGGYCFTYTATDTVQLIAWNSKSKMARVKLAPASEDTTVNISMDQFVSDDENVSLDEVVKNVTRLEIVLAGGLEAGTYENEFAIYEIGQFGGCGVRETMAEVRAKVQEAKGEATPDLEDGRIDPLDPEIYKTVKIGDQVWMAENLRIPYDYLSAETDDDPDVVTGEKMAYCPSDPDELAAKGCLYSWAAAMDSAGRLNGTTVPSYNVCGYYMDCTVESPVQGICPNGWHLPSAEEFETLLRHASHNGEYSSGWELATALAGDTANGSNWLGFSANPVGYTYGFASVSNVNYLYLWSADDVTWWYQSQILYVNGSGSGLSPENKNYGRSVRCVKDQVEE